MNPGVSMTSHSETATFASVTGTFASDYPVGNLADLVEIGEVARVTPSGSAAAFTAVLAASQSVQFVALVGHNLPAGASVRVRTYSDAGLSSLVADSGATTIPDPVDGLAQTFPFLMDAAASVRSVRVDLAGLSGDVDMGGLEIASWFAFPYISTGAEAGLEEGPDDLELIGGGAAGAESELVRTYDGEIAYLSMSTATTTGLDFQKLKGLTRPFVFVEDYDDPDTWARGCFLAVNADLPPMVAQLYDADTFQFRLREHVR